MAAKCLNCTNTGSVKRCRDDEPLCKQCFLIDFEENVHQAIVKNEMFRPGETIAIGASGGKDSTVLAHLLMTLNKKYGYGLNLILLSIDEGIKGYRDDSLKAVERNRTEYQLPLKILSYKELYSWTMDEIVAKIGNKNNCTFCGVFRRQALDRGAVLIKADKIATGHNADDVAETVLLNFLRGDAARLQRNTEDSDASDGSLPRVKPLKYSFEKEIVMYAYFQKLDYFSTECVYAPNSFRGYVRNYVKSLERLRPRSILDLVHSSDDLRVQNDKLVSQKSFCSRCGCVTSQKICKACLLLEGLNTNNLNLGVKQKARKVITTERETSTKQACKCECENGDISEQF